MVDRERALMERALKLAERGLGRTSPNPMVGAVIVADGEIVGQGFHRRAGEPHAEIEALRAAGARARGATLVCTLEPCCHQGRTGPCVLPLVTAGIARVVAATEDPNPLVSGGGIRYLREHGVRVETGVCEREARALNAPFFSVHTHGRPHVTAKIALSADAGVAHADGRPQRLTSPPLDRRMQRQRAAVDAIAVGAGTIVSDNPRLTVREVFRERPLTRVVFDGRLRVSPTAQVFATGDAGPILVVTTEEAVHDSPNCAAELRERGVDLVVMDTSDLGHALRALAERSLQSVLLEGGPRLHEAAFRAGVVDRVQLLVSPIALGDDRRPWLSVDEISFEQLRDIETSVVGPDVLIEANVHRTH